MSACRICRAPLSEVVVDLGMLPLPNVYVRPGETNTERLFPLVVYVCDRCFLVQIVPVETTEGIFGHYAYFSSFAKTCLAAAREYSGRMQQRFALGEHSQVVEAGSNDGYLLQYFRDGDIPVLGIEPAANIAAVACDKGIETWAKPFGVRTANELATNGRRADLLIANNVLAHVPDLHDFVGGLRIALAPRGTITPEPASRSTRPNGSRRRGPTTCSSCRGTCAMRSSIRWRTFASGAAGSFFHCLTSR